jgi:hypothetical protein
VTLWSVIHFNLLKTVWLPSAPEYSLSLHCHSTDLCMLSTVYALTRDLRLLTCVHRRAAELENAVSPVFK